MKSFTRQKFLLLLRHNSRVLGDYFRLRKNKFVDNLYDEYHQWPLWYVVSYIFGITFFFKFINSDLFFFLPVLLIVVCVLYKITKRHLILILVLFSLGLNVAHFRFATTKTTMISQPIKLAWVKARVIDIKRKFDGKMVLITEQNKIYKRNTNVDKLRVVSKDDLPELKIGDLIKFKASIIPAKKSEKTGFDFYRNDYYQNISGTAFSRNKIEIFQHSSKLYLIEKIDYFRDQISQYIDKKIGTRTGSLASALIVGVKGGIDGYDLENIRLSGLSHIFAVSGLHLTLIAATIFFMMRYSMSFSVYISQRYNTKKIAAFLTSFIVLFYLLITGIQISAVRAFLMILLVMIAIIIDLQIDLKRSIAIAAFLILLVKPEQIFHPSFQLSFIATLALVAVYELYRDRRLAGDGDDKQNKILYYLCGAMISTIIATLSTSMFVLYHFQFLSIYSLIANIFASPIVSLVIMPSVVLFFLLGPYFLGWIMLYPIDYGLFLMLKIAEISRYLDSFNFKSVGCSDLSLFVFSTGILWFCLWKNRWRYYGIIFSAMSFFIS